MFLSFSLVWSCFIFFQQLQSNTPKIKNTQSIRSIKRSTIRYKVNKVPFNTKQTKHHTTHKHKQTMPAASDDDYELLSSGGGSSSSSDDDELIEVQVQPTRSNSGSTRNNANANAAGTLILPRPRPNLSSSTRTSSRSSSYRPLSDQRRQPRSTPRDSAASASSSSSSSTTITTRQQQHQQASTAVIDLTEEPDSPVEARESQTQQSQSQTRNPRRVSSQRRLSPPTLARSDSTFMSRPSSSVIDLTNDSSPDHERHDDGRFRNSASSTSFYRPVARPDELFEVEIIRSARRNPGSNGSSRTAGVSNFAFGLGRRIAGILGTGIVATTPPFYQPHLDFSRTAFSPREPSPKPPMEPTPATRDGFTRDTCADPEKMGDRVIICPACRGELAYDPSDTAAQASGAKKRKRAPGEHHFWALKKCGHVCLRLFFSRDCGFFSFVSLTQVIY